MLADNDDYVFIGWKIQERPIPNARPLNVTFPIIVPKNSYLPTEQQPEVPPDIQNVQMNRDYGWVSELFELQRHTTDMANKNIIMVNQLYKIPNVRNINLYNLANPPNRIALFDGTTPLLFARPANANATRQDWYNINEALITELENNYPRLFQPIFVHAPGVAVAGGKSRRRRSKTIRRKRNR